jgi:hypothetical protein
MTDSAHQLSGLQDLTDADKAWAAWDKAWTKYVRRHAGRSDLTVVVAPDAGGGAPACFYPDHKRVEVNAAFLGGEPKIADPARAIHRQAVPAAYGLLVHEAAHAAHSRWRSPDDTAPIVAEVAEMLEESRIECRQRGRRRGDRRWLRRACVELLIPTAPAVDDPWDAGRHAALLLARVDARILTNKELRAVRNAVVGVLGKDRLQQLRQLWQAAHACDDTDAATMIDLAWQWCRVLGIDPATTPDVPQPDPGKFPGRLAAALADWLAAALGISHAELAAQLIAARHTPPASWSRRDPTDPERAAARRLGARLRQARTQHRETATRPASVPPGRLRTRQAITHDAQTAAGMPPTAQPWQRRTTLPPPKPPSTRPSSSTCPCPCGLTSDPCPRPGGSWPTAPAAATRSPPPSRSPTPPPWSCRPSTGPTRSSTWRWDSAVADSATRSNSPTRYSTCGRVEACGCSRWYPTAIYPTRTPPRN